MSFLLATAPAPLFGNAWLALLAVLGGVAVFMMAIAATGRWLAATHPDPLISPGRKAIEAAAAPATPPELVVVISAAIASEIGERARVAAIRPVHAMPSVEMLIQQWSLEGRRQIYSSHQIR